MYTKFLIFLKLHNEWNTDLKKLLAIKPAMES